MKYLLALCFVALALPALSQAPKTTPITMLVEHDPWTAKCKDDARVPGTQGFGAGYSGLNKPFTPGHAYRVTGRLGWDFRLSVLMRKGFDVYIGRSFWRIQAEIQWNAGRTCEIDRPVIAVGTSDNNALIRYAVQEHNWTRYADRGFPGPGRGYVAHLWQPFSLTDDSILVIGADAKGLKEAVSWLAKQVR